MPDLSDPPLKLPTLATDAQRFAQAVLPHVDAAYNLARWLSGDAQDADDIVQEACLRAFRLFGGFRGGDGRPWLLAIVRNTWFSECARRKQAPAQPWDDAAASQADDESASYGVDPAALLARVDDVRRVHAALAQLPVPYREVLVLRELEDLPYRDIAAVVDAPIGTVMSRLARGRQQLARLLTEDTASKVSPSTNVTPIRASGGIGNSNKSTKEARHDL